jgi:hypothetical protein
MKNITHKRRACAKKAKKAIDEMLKYRAEAPPNVEIVGPRKISKKLRNHHIKTYTAACIRHIGKTFKKVNGKYKWVNNKGANS